MNDDRAKRAKETTTWRLPWDARGVLYPPWNDEKRLKMWWTGRDGWLPIDEAIRVADERRGTNRRGATL